MQVVQCVLVIVVSQIVMMLRVYALSGRNKSVRFALCTFLTAEFIFGIVILSLPGNVGKWMLHSIPVALSDVS
jgi:hypothetical protein